MAIAFVAWEFASLSSFLGHFLARLWQIPKASVLIFPPTMLGLGAESKFLSIPLLKRLLK